jgi:2-dehydropantoate 2-reductase
MRQPLNLRFPLSETQVFQRSSLYFTLPIQRGVILLREISSISVIGLGAIGAAYASRLHDMDPNAVRVIADEERIKRYQQSGVTVNGKRYDFRYVLPSEPVQPADLILVAVKYDGLAQAIEDMKHHVGEETIILPLLNGISSEEMIAKVYGGEKVLYAMCVAIDAVRSGTDVRFSSIGRIHFGHATNRELSPPVRKVKNLFDRAGIPYEIPEDMLHDLWWKFMINVGINQTSAVLKAPYKVFQQIPEAYELMKAAMMEVIQLSEKAGVYLTEQDFANFHQILMNNLAPDGKTSMLQDIAAGRKTEVDFFAGTVCELGKKYGVATPVNEMLLKMIRTLEKMAKTERK